MWAESNLKHEGCCSGHEGPTEARAEAVQGLEAVEAVWGLVAVVGV